MRIDVVRDLVGTRRVADLFTAIWGQRLLEAALLQALAHAGNYVAAAYADDGDMLAASVGFLGLSDREPLLHSHVTGVRADVQGKSIGLALKHHQRAWCLERGIATIEWTFDPLVRRNGYFNLVKLGAAVVAYYPNFYGAMVDGINQGDDTDRGLVRWDLAPPPDRSEPGPAAGAEEAVPVVTTDEVGRPATAELPTGTAPLLVAVPEDIVAIRQHEPGLARAWRLAVRDTMGVAMSRGYQATTMTSDGSYVLTRAPQ